MPVNKPHIRDAGVYFVTFTNYKWLPLFQLAGAYTVVYKWFDHLATSGHRVLSYVIMPNHFHALIAFGASDKSINAIIGNGKRFMAYGIISQLKANNQSALLLQLEQSVNATDRKRGKLHEVFQPSFDIKRCDTFKFIYQKMDYIHDNPVTKKWNLAQNRYDYLHSSARFYDKGAHSEYTVTHVDEFLDIWIEV